MWKNLRLWYLKQHPLCQKCLERGFIVAAKEVHHKYKISSGIDYQQKLQIALNINNLSSLCIPCHHDEDKNNF